MISMSRLTADLAHRLEPGLKVAILDREASLHLGEDAERPIFIAVTPSERRSRASSSALVWKARRSSSTPAV
jgi:hypothetical protein